MNTRRENPKLRVSLHGPGVERGRILVKDLVTLASEIQTAVAGIGRLITGEAESLRPGPRPKEIEQECSLELVAFQEGSTILEFQTANLTPSRETEALFALGSTAVECLVQGIGRLETQEALPRGFDPGILKTLRSIGGLLDGRIEDMELEVTSKPDIGRVRFTRQTKEAVERKIAEPISSQRAFEGLLLMVDLKPSRRVCRLHPLMGPPIQCEFSEDMKEEVIPALDHFVRVTGKAFEDPATHRVEKIWMSDVEALQIEPPQVLEGDWLQEFRAIPTLDELTELQGVTPIASLDSLYAEFWPEADSVDDLLAVVDEIRSERTDTG